MKKRFLLLVLGVSILGISACSGKKGPSHTHTFSDEWSYDEQTHWHAATCGHDVKADEEAHTLVLSEDETYETCFCGYVHALVSELAAPTNLAFDQGVLSFSAVEHAKKYDVAVSQDGINVLSETITETSIELFDIGIGQFTASVVARADTLSSAPANLNINQKYLRQDPMILEAEDYVTNDANISVDANAHGGKYTLGFDDCGQGLNFRYYSFAEGTQNVDIYYSTGAPGSYMTLYVNEDEDNGIPVYFNDNTGWFGDSAAESVVGVNVALQKGWNDIYLFKNGTAQDSPEYGGWVQIDYIEMSGTDAVLDVTTVDDLDLEHYRLEAEQAKWHWANQYQRPNMSDAWPSHGYLGEINAFGDGVTYNVNIAKAGTYLLKFASAAGNEGRYFDVTVNGVKENRHVQTGPSWNVVAEDEGFLVHLNEGANTIDFSRGENGNWACIDYLKIDFVSDEDPVLPTAVSDLAFADNTLTFTAAQGISEYRVVLEKDQQELASAIINGTSYEVPASIHGENIKATVYAKKGFFVAAEGSSLLINPGIIVDRDVILEAEDAIIGEKHYSADGQAHGGAYALGFDNCGEGMYFRYYSYKAGERVITVTYATGAPGSKMDLRINEGTPSSITFTENTNWFGDAHVTANVDATVTLVKGWNDIFLYKNGTSSDNPQWGGWVQVDYITVKGSGESFDTAELTDLVCSKYKLEAEFGNYGIAGMGAPDMGRPDAFSIAYLGSQDEEGNGVTYKFKVDQAGTYKVQFFCGGEGSRKVSMKVNGNAITDQGQSYYTVATGNGWDVVAGDPGFEVQLNAGFNTIQMARLSNEAGGGWICIDYCLVTLVA